MGATFARSNVWVSLETLTAAELNAEYDNILTNLTPAGMDDESANATAMRATVDPYPAGSESLATALQGELHRIRYILTQLTGNTYWYQDTTCPEAIMQFDTGATTVADSVTRYFGNSNVSAGVTDVLTRVPYKCTVTNLHCVVPGAATGTRTYTLQKNGADTTLTCASTGTGLIASDVVNSVSFAIGDTIAVKLITSGGSDAVTHAATISLKKVP
jgi:hypothetical protein